MSRLSVSALILALCILLTACSRTNDDQDKKVFNLNLEQGLTSLDPAFARNQFVLWMTNQLYNGLVQVNDSLETIPAIAKSWDISADGLTYTFHLRNDVFFHDDPLFPGGK